MQKRDDVKLDTPVDTMTNSLVLGRYDPSCPEQHLALIGNFMGLCQALKITLGELQHQVRCDENESKKSTRSRLERKRGEDAFKREAVAAFTSLSVSAEEAYERSKTLSELCATKRTKFAHGYWGLVEGKNERVFISFGGEFSGVKVQRSDQPEQTQTEADALLELRESIRCGMELLEWMNSKIPRGWSNSTIASATGPTIDNS